MIAIPSFTAVIAAPAQHPLHLLALYLRIRYLVLSYHPHVVTHFEWNDMPCTERHIPLFTLPDDVTTLQPRSRLRLVPLVIGAVLVGVLSTQKLPSLDQQTSLWLAFAIGKEMHLLLEVDTFFVLLFENELSVTTSCENLMQAC